MCRRKYRIIERFVKNCDSCVVWPNDVYLVFETPSKYSKSSCINSSASFVRSQIASIGNTFGPRLNSGKSKEANDKRARISNAKRMREKQNTQRTHNLYCILYATKRGRVTKLQDDAFFVLSKFLLDGVNAVKKEQKQFMF